MVVPSDLATQTTGLAIVVLGIRRVKVGKSENGGELSSPPNREGKTMARDWVTWKGSQPGDFPEGPIPPDFWPYGPPSIHQVCCLLFKGHTYCDCDASAATGPDGEE